VRDEDVVVFEQEAGLKAQGYREEGADRGVDPAEIDLLR
jgi:hypothetical protein